MSYRNLFALPLGVHGFTRCISRSSSSRIIPRFRAMYVHGSASPSARMQHPFSHV